MELSSAKLKWENGSPQSMTFGDIYFSKEGGIAETHAVFLAANQLAERLAARPDKLTIGETGFGTGLNLLCLLALWQSHPAPRPKLHFITTELYPLSPADMVQAHQAWPELAALSEMLRAVYPPAIAGAHRRYLFEGAVCVDFLWGDAAEKLSAYHPIDAAPVDCWFLDGFSPALNPDMWTPNLFEALAGLSHAGTTLSSFTVAGDVRRGLGNVGFTVTKQAGYGRKREMLTAVFEPEKATHTPPPLVNIHQQTGPIVVVGAGIAGVATAWQLARQLAPKGQNVCLIDRGAQACQAASSSPASAFTPFFQTEWTPRARLLMAGFLTTEHILAELRAKGHSFEAHQNGMVMLDMAAKNKRCQRFSDWQHSLDVPAPYRQTLSVEAVQALTGADLPYAGWLYPQAGWLCLSQLAQAMLADAGEKIDCHFATEVTALHHENGQWHLALTSLSDGQKMTMPASRVVLCQAYDAAALIPELSLTKVHGQILQLEKPAGLRDLTLPLNCGFTLLPDTQGRLHWGASFRHKISSPEILPEETEHLLAAFHDCFDFLPEAERAAVTQNAKIDIWAGLRCTHPSRMPLIGSVPNQPAGLYVNLAHGARGSLTGALMMPASLYAH